MCHGTVAFNDSIAIRKPAFGSENAVGMKVDGIYSKYEEKPVDKCFLAL